jgi:hypothetical protein
MTVLLRCWSWRIAPVVVAGMEPDRRLVEHVTHPDQPGSQARHQPNSLQLSAAERVGRTVQREIVQPEPLHEIEPGADVGNDRLGDRTIVGVELQRGEKTPGLRDRKRRDLVNGFPADANGQGLRAKPCPAAFRAPQLAAKRIEPLPDGILGRVLVLAMENRQHAKALLPVAPQQGFQRLRLQLVQRRVPSKARRRHQVAKERLRFAHRRRHVAPRHDRPRRKRQRQVGRDQLRIELLLHPKPFAFRAHAVRTVETERPRFEFLEADAALRAGILGAEKAVVPYPRRFVAGVVRDHDQPFPVPHRKLHRLGQPSSHAGPNHDPVDHRLDVMRLLMDQLRRMFDVDHLPVHPGANESRLPDRCENLAVFALATPDHRRKDHRASPFDHRRQLVDDLLRRLLPDRLVALVAANLAEPGHQQPEIVVNLRHRRHRAPRISAASPLVDRNGRLEPFDQIDVRPLHLVQELPRIHRQALDVLPLALRKQRVERQRTLPRAARAGYHHQPVAGNIEIDVAKIMRTRAAYADRMLRAGGVCGSDLTHPRACIAGTSFNRPGFDADTPPPGPSRKAQTVQRTTAAPPSQAHAPAGQPKRAGGQTNQPEDRHSCLSAKHVVSGQARMPVLLRVIAPESPARDPRACHCRLAQPCGERGVFQARCRWSTSCRFSDMRVLLISSPSGRGWLSPNPGTLAPGADEAR